MSSIGNGSRLPGYMIPPVMQHVSDHSHAVMQRVSADHSHAACVCRTVILLHVVTPLCSTSYTAIEHHTIVRVSFSFSSWH